MCINILIIWASLLAFITNFTPEIAQLQYRIAELQQSNHRLSQKRNANQVDRDDPKSKYLLNYDISDLKLKQNCFFQGKNLSTMFIQTTNEVYLVLNIPQKKRVQVYNSKCDQISVLNQIQIKYILSDRGTCQNGMIYFISSNNQLFLMSQDSKLQGAIKLSDLNSKYSFVGGVIRYRNKQKLQIFVAYKDGTIDIYDEVGKHKLKLFIEGDKSQIRFLVDYHPYPLIITTSNWISMLDTTKYIELTQNCPFIPKIRQVVSQHHYGDTLYLIAAQKIYGLGFQLGKKQCLIKKQYDLPVQLGHLDHISIYSNSIYIDSKVFNMTNQKLYKRIDCVGNTHLEFLVKRGSQEKQICVRKCCTEQSCRVQFKEVEKPQQSRGVFLYLSVGFIVILVVSLSLTKKNGKQSLDFDQATKQPSDFSEQKLLQVSRKNKEKGSRHKKK